METKAVWIRGTELRKRWGGMPTSTFYYHLSRGLVPKPEYPFGPATPYWRLSTIEAHEQAAAKVAA